MVHQWPGNYPAAQTESQDCPSGALSEPLTKESKLWGSKRSWAFRNPQEYGGSLLRTRPVKINGQDYNTLGHTIDWRLRCTICPVCKKCAPNKSACCFADTGRSFWECNSDYQIHSLDNWRGSAIIPSMTASVVCSCWSTNVTCFR